MGYPCSALFALVCVLSCSMALGALCWHVLVQEGWIELKGSPWLSIKLLCKKIRHMSWFFIQLLSNFFLLVKLLGTFGEWRAQKRLFCSKSSARTYNHKHTTHNASSPWRMLWVAALAGHILMPQWVEQQAACQHWAPCNSGVNDMRHDRKILLSAVEIYLDLRMKRSFLPLPHTTSSKP